MPKNKQKLSHEFYKKHNEYRQLPLKLKTESEYALVLQYFGQNHFAVKCFDNIVRLAVLRGSLRHRIWISENDIVLVGLRSF